MNGQGVFHTSSFLASFNEIYENFLSHNHLRPTYNEYMHDELTHQCADLYEIQRAKHKASRSRSTSSAKERARTL